MYPKFIEVHAKSENPLEDVVTFVNVAHIMYFHGNVICTPKGFFSVSETFDELKALITDSGCLIHKGDPRLNMEHPLTMDDLMTMVGEPVWNSNIGEWGLITKDPEWHDETLSGWKRQSGYYLRYHDDTITRFDEEDLKKFPLYRIRK